MNRNFRFIIYSLNVIGILLFTLSCKKTENTIYPAKGNTTAVFNPVKTYGTMTDQDGNVYKTISIGTQTWMAENLCTTKFRNGETISEVADNKVWVKLKTSAFCIYNNVENSDSIATNGRLYNWYAATDTRNIAPEGWHMPSKEEWATLANNLSGELIAGDKLKETGTMHWVSPNTNATNETGFTALPSGGRFDPTGQGLVSTFGYLGSYCHYWSSTEHATMAWCQYLSYKSSIFTCSDMMKLDGLSVRLLKDN